MDILERVKQLNFSPTDFIVLGSGVLEVYGIRDAHDLDILVTAERFDTLKHLGWNLDQSFLQKWNRERLVYEDVEIYRDFYLARTDTFLYLKDLMSDVVHIDNIPFLSLQKLIEFKTDNGREKDMFDVSLIEKYLRNQSSKETKS